MPYISQTSLNMADHIAKKEKTAQKEVIIKKSVLPTQVERFFVLFTLTKSRRLDLANLAQKKRARC